MSDESPITFHAGDDPDLLQAADRARRTFRDFWYHVALDFNRIVPALELACVKVPFSDSDDDTDEAAEQMWVGEINFDGLLVSGVLLNQPGRLKSVQQGDDVRFAPGRLTDWMCVLEGKVYGGYSVQVIRSRMEVSERRDHDDAWGLEFPPPETVRTLSRNETFEQVIASLIVEQVSSDPAMLSETYEAGRTPLHLEALYGRAPSVGVLLRHGADPEATCDRGWTALDYARTLDWSDCIEQLGGGPDGQANRLPTPKDMDDEDTLPM